MAWLITPLVALGLPVAYRVAIAGDLSSALRVNFPSDSLELLFCVSTLASALALVACMAARRRGRTVWAELDVFLAAMPWMIALHTQAAFRADGQDGYRRAMSEEVLPWGLVDTSVVLARGLNMCALRSVGALVSAALCAGAAVGFLRLHAERPSRWSLRVIPVALPAWAVLYGYLSSGSVLPFIGALFLTLVLGYVFSQSSEAARTSGRTAVVLAALAAIALNVSATCDTVVASQPFRTPDFIAANARLYDTTRALLFSSLLATVPVFFSTMTTDWPLPPTPRINRSLLSFLFAGAVTLDQTSSLWALRSITPDPWPPWSHGTIAPLPLGEQARPVTRRSEPPRFILVAGELLDGERRRLAGLSDSAALREALVTALQAPLAGPVPTDAPQREAIAPVLDQPATAAPLCPGGVVSVLFDRTVTMPDVRAFVAAAAASGVVELDVAGPKVLSSEAKVALLEARFAAGRHGVWPHGSSDELDYLTVASALPPTWVGPLDIQRAPLTAHTVLLPGPCWLNQLAPRSGILPGDGGAVREPNATRLWLDPAREVSEFLLAATASHQGDENVVWTLDPPAP